MLPESPVAHPEMLEPPRPRLSMVPEATMANRPTALSVESSMNRWEMECPAPWNVPVKAAAPFPMGVKPCPEFSVSDAEASMSAVSL